jgi:hypothetical protein
MQRERWTEHPLLPRGVCGAEDAVIAADLSSWAAMSTPQSRRFPVTVIHLPVTHCQICHRTSPIAPAASARS